MKRVVKSVPATPRNPRKPLSRGLPPYLEAWADRQSHLYLGIGGAGDALLLLAACYRDPKARITFFANELDFCPKFFEIFGVPTLVRTNDIARPQLRKIVQTFRKLPGFRTSAHLPDNLRYNEWRDLPGKYERRIVARVPWREHLGLIPPAKPSVVICPSGSVQADARRRFLTVDEYNHLVGAYLAKGFAIYTVGSEANLQQYRLYPSPDCTWLSAGGRIDQFGRRIDISLMEVLQRINGAQEVISVDTWVKTYSLLAGIPTKVIATRWHGEYRIGTSRDASDRVFLNPKIWPELRLCTFESLVGS